MNDAMSWPRGFGPVPSSSFLFNFGPKLGNYSSKSRFIDIYIYIDSSLAVTTTPHSLNPGTRIHDRHPCKRFCCRGVRYPFFTSLPSLCLLL